MTIEGDVKSTNTTKIHLDGGKKNLKGKKNKKGNEEVLPIPTPSDVITSHLPSITEASAMNLARTLSTPPLEKNRSQGWKWRDMPWRY